MASLGHGTDLSSGNISSIGEIRSIGFTVSAGSVDTTQTTSPFAQSIPTAVGSVVSVSLYYNGNNGSEAEDFINELKAKQITSWEIDFPDGKFTTNGFVSNAAVSASYGSPITLDITIQCTGEPDFDGD